MNSKSQQGNTMEPPSRPEATSPTWVRKPVFPPISTAPLVNRTSMVARPWERIKLFSARRKESREARQERRAVARDGSSPQLVEWQRDGRMRRAVLFMLTFVQTAIAGVLTIDSLPKHGDTLLERMVVILFTILFFWVSAGFWTAMAGFLVLMRGDRHGVASAKAIKREAVQGEDFRTAIVMPICNEDVARVFAGLRATYESLAKTEQAGQFDVFVLSDSSDSDICTAELDAWSTLCRAVGGFGNIFYRRRKRRVKRKSGNIADFCRRWGKNYRYMIVLDADSVMSGECLTSLVDLMEANPDAGIIQTAPRVAGRETLYARIQQFASRAYGPLYTAGLHFWQLGESHYWGHNAIIRVEPFTRHCALAPLPGKGPLSGEILSHDFIEAALIRRAGWTVWIAYDLPGSYEELPPNLLDELQRDRRWCRGNMMNFRLILEHGIHPVYRAVFATGLMAYLSSLLWLTFLVLSTIVLATEKLMPAAETVAPAHLIPEWQLFHPYHALQLFIVTTSLLILPKFLAVLRICLKDAREFGGVARLMLSMMLELMFSVLSAPIRMLFHSRFVVEAITGKALHWKSPARGDEETTWGEAWKRHGSHTMLGLTWGVAVYLLNPGYLVWLLPVVGALALSIPLSVLSSRVSIGSRLRKLRLFLIPEEGQQPEELRATVAYHSSAKSLPGFVEAVVDPAINALVCACGRKATAQPVGTSIVRRTLLQAALHEGPASLTAPERQRLLNDPQALFQLHRNVWETPGAHPHWHELNDGE
ncbi:MAG TPA: glucans biosynthesis glucosyltransferase MdoH [Burkholderiaceae bacterium]